MKFEISIEDFVTGISLIVFIMSVAILFLKLEEIDLQKRIEVLEQKPNIQHIQHGEEVCPVKINQLEKQ